MLYKITSNCVLRCFQFQFQLDISYRASNSILKLLAKSLNEQKIALSFVNILMCSCLDNWR